MTFQQESQYADLGDQESPEPQNIRHGRWTKEQQRQYLDFVSNNSQMLARANTRGKKAFKNMAFFISTRSSLQCRSHHQKMLQKEFIRKLIEDPSHSVHALQSKGREQSEPETKNDFSVQEACIPPFLDFTATTVANFAALEFRLIQPPGDLQLQDQDTLEKEWALIEGYDLLIPHF